MSPVVHELSLVILAFGAYSVLGWIHELVYGAVVDRTLRNPGFLYGPIVPIYGFGAIFVIGVLGPLAENPAAVFIASGVICAVVEYVGHLILERLGVRLWDYSDRRANLHGRICLSNLVGFAALATLVFYTVAPALQTRLESLAPPTAAVAAVAVAVALLTDAAVSVARRGRRGGRERPIASWRQPVRA